MAKRKLSEDSSLELLLDTMCNTFGGVMFIAIALVVLMSMMSNIKMDSPVTEEDFKKMQEKLQILTETNKDLEKQLAALKNHPGRNQISDILKLEKQLTALTIQQKIIKLQKDLEQQNIFQQTTLNSNEMKQIAKEQSRMESFEKELSDLNAKLAKMKKSSNISSYAMTFRVMEKHREMPYLFIIDKNKIWRVGPEQFAPSQPLLPHSDCTYVQNILKEGTAVRCQPKSEKGIPILEDGKISEEVIKIIQAVPKDRIAKFSISKNSIRSFCMLREYLKQKKILHGVDTKFEHFHCYGYVLVPQKNIEYDY